MAMHRLWLFMHARRIEARRRDLAAVFSTFLLCATAHAERAQESGILRARDLTPFGLQRLDMRPTDLTEAPVGEWSVELQAAYQNTFALSDQAHSHLHDRNTGRIELRPEDAQAILSTADDAYYVDVEVGVVDLIVQRRLTAALGVFFEIPYIHYGEGLLDGFIEGFHDTFGFGQMGRDLVARDRFQIVYHFGDTYVQLLDREVKGGFGDPIAGVRYIPTLPSSSWRLAFEIAAKLPVGGDRLLLSTGETDVGVQGSARRTFGRSALQTSASVVHYSGGIESPADQIIPTLIVAYSYAATQRTSIIIQGYASRSAVRDTTLRELKANKYQLSLGLQSRVESWSWSFAVTENIANFDNTPDIGVQFGLTYVGDR
jgi:hypothetical protein